MADIGALLSGISGSLAQARDYNLAVANARVSAGIRMQQLELQGERTELERTRVQQAMEEGRIKTQAEKLDLEAKLREAKLIQRGERFISQAKSLEKMAGRETLSGKRPWEAEFIPEISPGRKLEAYELAGRTAPLAIKEAAEEEAMTPIQRRARKADIEFKEAQTVESVRRAARPVDVGGTQKDRDRAKWLSPDTPEDERALIERDLFGGKTTIDGVSLNDISRILNDLHPEVFGQRENVPEGINPNSIEFIRYGARLVREAQDSDVGLVPIPDAEITSDSLFIR